MRYSILQRDINDVKRMLSLYLSQNNRAARAYRLQRTKDEVMSGVESGVWGRVTANVRVATRARSALAFSIDDDALGARALPFSNATPTRVLPTFLFHFVHQQHHISSLSTGQVRPSSITRFHSPTRLRLKWSFQIAAQVHVHQQGTIRGA